MYKGYQQSITHNFVYFSAPLERSLILNALFSRFSFFLFFSERALIHPNQKKQTEIGEGEIKYPPLIPLIFFLNKRESHTSLFFFFNAYTWQISIRLKEFFNMAAWSSVAECSVVLKTACEKTQVPRKMPLNFNRITPGETQSWNFIHPCRNCFAGLFIGSSMLSLQSLLVTLLMQNLSSTRL